MVFYSYFMSEYFIIKEIKLEIESWAICSSRVEYSNYLELFGN